MKFDGIILNTFNETQDKQFSKPQNKMKIEEARKKSASGTDVP